MTDAQTASITRFAKHFLTREQDSMTTYAEELQDERHAAMQKFNDNEFFLDAQPTDRDPEGVTMYSEAGDEPRLVAMFPDVATFEAWAHALNRLSEDLVAPVIESMIETQQERAQREAIKTFLAPIFTVAEGDDRSNVKSLRFIDTITEKAAA